MLLSLDLFANYALNIGTLVNTTIVLENKDVESQKSSEGACVPENRLHPHYGRSAVSLI
jgi:hypothetical protein